MSALSPLTSLSLSFSLSRSLFLSLSRSLFLALPRALSLLFSLSFSLSLALSLSLYLSISLAHYLFTFLSLQNPSVIIKTSDAESMILQRILIHDCERNHLFFFPIACLSQFPNIFIQRYAIRVFFNTDHLKVDESYDILI